MAKIDRLMKKAQEHLDPGEEILVGALGAYETKSLGQDTVRTGVLMATSNRLAFYSKRMFGHDFESFPYSNISSFESGKTLMGHHVSFFASGNKVAMKWINAGNVEGLIREVRGRMGKGGSHSKVAPSPQEPDIPAQIEKLAELKAKGILSEDEFATKKQELLAKL